MKRRAEGACQLLILRNIFKHIKGMRKKWIFYGQADREGEGDKGGPAPSALTVSKCENFDPFFH